MNSIVYVYSRCAFSFLTKFYKFLIFSIYCSPLRASSDSYFTSICWVPLRIQRKFIYIQQLSINLIKRFTKAADLLWYSGQKHRFASKRAQARMFMLVIVSETGVMTEGELLFWPCATPKNAECLIEDDIPEIDPLGLGPQWAVKTRRK